VNTRRHSIARLLHFVTPDTVRARVALVLNLSLLVLVALFLTYDYHRDSADRLEMTRTALDEQAKLLSPGVRACRDAIAVSEYLQAARESMEDTHDFPHIVAADVDGQFHQSGLGADGPADFAERLRNASNLSPTIDLKGRTFMAGRHRTAALEVYVLEDLADVRAAVREDLKRHIFGIATALLIGIAILNVTLWLAFQRPIARLTKAVSDIGSGRLGLKLERIGAAEFDLLADAINDMSQALAESDAARAAQMRKARGIQDSLRPVDLRLPGLKIAARFQPTEEIAGDYYDFIPLPDGSALFCIADVTGHGVSAALVAAMVKASLLNAVESTTHPARILEVVNRHLNALNLPEMFASMFILRVDPKSRRIEYAGAGHPSLLLCSPAGACRELESDGPILGIGIDYEWTGGSAQVEAGERILLYTDGVTEVFGPSQSQFGLSGLKSELSAARSRPSEQVLPSIMQALERFSDGAPFHDDVTLLFIEIDSQP
jgi:sigma-B regulation protein RsbU (phosphoserine phosphatase)